MGDIKHIIVLMLENRSFDHMLGWLDHPAKAQHADAFLTGKESNPRRGIWPLPIKVWGSPKAAYGVKKEPGHTHKDVDAQMFGVAGSPMKGFALNHQKIGRCGDPREVMRYNLPEQVPVLSTLARRFHLCADWYCSVPGATWPNRFFAMAGHSLGEMDNKPASAPVKLHSLFHEFQCQQRSDWAIYHDGPCLALLMRGMYGQSLSGHYREQHKILQDIADHTEAKKTLPALSWVEPDHFGVDSSSQHPGFMSGKYDTWAFTRGEKLIADIYSALCQNMALFKETLLVITYDEHGGFHDHVLPPANATPPGIESDKEKELPFKQLGPRVPTILINPLMPEGVIDRTHYDHSAIVRMVSDCFLKGVDRFGKRAKDMKNPLEQIQWQAAPGPTPDVSPIKVVDDRPSDWCLKLADHADDLMLDLMKGLQQVVNHVLPLQTTTMGMKHALPVNAESAIELAIASEQLQHFIDRAEGRPAAPLPPPATTNLKILNGPAEEAVVTMPGAARNAVTALLNVPVADSEVGENTFN